MKRNLVRLSAATMLALAVAAFDACSDSTAAGRGTIVVKLTDAPFPVDSVDSVNIYVVRVDARVAAADSGDAAEGATDDSAHVGGWVTIAEPNESINLLSYQNGTTFTLGTTTLAAGSYAGFRFVIDPSRSSLRLKNGLLLSGTTTPDVTFPSASRSGLKINLSGPVTIVEDGTTTFIVDFDVGNSFVMRGNSITQNGLLFKPVIQGTVSAGSTQ